MKLTEELGPRFKCGGPHFLSRCTNNERNANEKSQNYKKFDNSGISQHNHYINGQFPTGAISYQVSRQVKPGDDISLLVNIIKCFLIRIGEKYTLQKKSNTLSDIPKSQ